MPPTTHTEIDAAGGNTPTGWTLVTGPWFVVSRIVGLTAFLLLALCNLPGQEVLRLKESPAWDEWELEQRFEHGWPATSVSRSFDDSWGDSAVLEECWAIWENEPQVRTWGLVLNAVVAVALSWLCGLAFEAWRRQRHRLWQLYLRDLMAAVLLVSAVGAWYLREQRQSRYLQAALQSRDRSLQSVATAAGGATWIRKLAGDEKLAFLDRPAAIELDRRGLVHLPHLREVQHVHFSGVVSDETLRQLESLPQLCVLDLSLSVMVDERGQTNFFRKPPISNLTFPPLAGLRALDLTYVDYRVRGLDRLESLQSLDLTGAFVDEAVMEQVAALPQLTRLNLSTNGYPIAPLAALPSMSGLTELTIQRAKLGEQELAHIGRLTNLRRLSLARCQVAGKDLRHLAPLASLEHLDLSSTPTTLSSLMPLAEMPRLRTLNVTGTSLSRRDAPKLRELFSRCQIEGLAER